MNYDADVIKIRYDFMKEQLPDVFDQLEKEGVLGAYLEMIKDEFYNFEDDTYNRLMYQYLKSRKCFSLSKNADRLAKEVELRQQARDIAAQKVLFRKSR